MFTHDDLDWNLTSLLPVYTTNPVIPSSIIVLTATFIFAFTYKPVAIPILSPLATIVLYLPAYMNCDKSPIVLNMAGYCGMSTSFLFSPRPLNAVFTSFFMESTLL